METIMSIDAIKTSDKMCLYILDGHLEGTFFILIKDTYERPRANIFMLNYQPFLPKIRKKVEISTFLTCIQKCTRSSTKF